MPVYIMCSNYPIYFPDDEETIAQSKRRRIKPDILDSSSEDGNILIMKTCPCNIQRFLTVGIESFFRIFFSFFLFLLKT